MDIHPPEPSHSAKHQSGASAWGPPARDILGVGSLSRRWFLRAGLSGVAGLSAAPLMRLQAEAAAASGGTSRNGGPKSVIVFWLSGGPSHLDMWDPKPDAPGEVRGPFGSIPTRIPGVRLSEHLPLQARIM